MNNWKTTIKIDDLHEARRSGEMTIQQVARALAERLKKNRYAKDGPHMCFAILDVIDGLEDMAEAPESTVDDYDQCLAELYDFGDAGKRIWVDSSSLTKVGRMMVWSANPQACPVFSAVLT